jgi:DedD protein
MASSSSPEASEIRRRGRRRLLGAITLVLLAVVFVPMILDNEPRPHANEPSLVIPNRELAKPLPPPTPAAGSAASPQPATPAASGASAPKPATPPAAPSTPAAAPSTKAAQAAQEPAVAPTSPGRPSAPSATPKPATVVVTPPKASETAAASSPRLEGFAVQVGAFRDEAHLEQVRQKLTAAGVVHYTERIDSGGAPVTRLRAGPFPTREAAESARATLHQAALEGQVVPLP